MSMDIVDGEAVGELASNQQVISMGCRVFLGYRKVASGIEDFNSEIILKPMRSLIVKEDQYGCAITTSPPSFRTVCGCYP